MNGLGHQFFAGATFTFNQGCRRGGPHPPDGLKHFQHGGTFSDDVVKSVARSHLGLETAVFLNDPIELHRLLRVDHQAFIVEGLENERIGPFLHRFNGLIHRAMRRHHDDRQIGRFLFDPAQQLKTIHTGHLHIRDHQIHVFDLENIKCLGRTVGRVSGVAFLFEHHAQYGRVVFFIVNDEDGFH